MQPSSGSAATCAIMACRHSIGAEPAQRGTRKPTAVAVRRLGSIGRADHTRRTFSRTAACQRRLR
eukprot:3239339-Rhodomonas_salina.1